MILLSLGTHQQAFPRALDLVEPLAGCGHGLLVQHGSTPRRTSWQDTQWYEYMPYERLVEEMARADGVVCHAGVGTIMTALQAGHSPLVIPREGRYGEHVDDHQLEIATRFADRGLIRCVTDDSDLEELLCDRVQARTHEIGKGSLELRAAVAAAVAAAPPTRRRRLQLRRRISS